LIICTGGAYRPFLHDRHFSTASSFQIDVPSGRADRVERDAGVGFAAAAHREPTTYSRIPLVARPEGLTMKAANWIILAVLLGMLSATIWIGYDMWTTTSNIPVSENGYIAMGIGAALSLLIGCGLMALLFYSSRHG
jgi:hypothetical protein